ncbi:MAG: hypothetical protein ABIN91_11085 [Mucilaginibacter sp.]|uniref:hypothetical protein n=1 Tax=Mucilaginibacter sp. TaxID=1882438 RepID=UPI00326744A8
MKKLSLDTKPTTKGTAKLIRVFVYENRDALSSELKAFYQTVAGMIDREVLKPSARRATVSDLTERSYNIDLHVLAAGAAGFEQEFISMNNL